MNGHDSIPDCMASNLCCMAITAGWATMAHPTLAAAAGGTLTFEDSNMNGMGQSLQATVSTDNFVSPGDDLSFTVTFRSYGLSVFVEPLQLLCIDGDMSF